MSAATTVPDPSTGPPTASRRASAAVRVVVLTTSLTIYAVFFGTFLYLIGFVGGAVVPKAIDDGPLRETSAAILVNVGFLALFAVQHTIMARPAFKRWWVQIIPASLERSIFVGVASAILIAMVIFWRPIPGTVWHAEGVAALAIHGLFAIGWATVLLSTFLIDHFELFGLKQAFAFAMGRDSAPPQFQERLLYRYTRHPLMLGFLIAFWATPHMTWGHLLFASVTTAYILVALVIEERTLVALHGSAYEEYRRRVPKLIPRLVRAR